MTSPVSKHIENLNAPFRNSFDSTFNKVQPDGFVYLLSQIKDGYIFESFAQDLLCEIIGIEFTPLGGVHDRAIDGLDHTFKQKHTPSTIYQISIQANSKGKIKNTINALLKNKIQCERLFYVTNKIVEDKDIIVESIYKEFKINVSIRDASWLRGNINRSEGTCRIYAAFLDKHTHQFNSPSQELYVTDFIKDPRLFVFLRQQIDFYGSDYKLNELLIDSLILYTLEGTDPDKEKFKTREDILKSINDLTSLNIPQINHHLDSRLKHLSKQPRRIRCYKKENKYCLPYKTRCQLGEQRLADEVLFNNFCKKTSQRLSKHLELFNLNLKNLNNILGLTFNEIFKKQGLDFSNFVLKTQSPTTLENELENIISTALEQSGIAEINREAVGLSVLATIREILYHGSEEELEYLRRLSRSYLMLFLVKCDPHVCTYFDNLASNLRIFVGNSIIIPALSEIALETYNRRHWNLLLSANKANVRLIINRATLEELANHLQLIQKIYREKYEGLESHYSDERTLRYVPEILIRAYLYQRANGSNIRFNIFLNKIITPNQKKELILGELQQFLQAEFGIEFIEDEPLGVQLKKNEVKRLTKVLCPLKGSYHQAINDAKTILTIYALRAKDNETGNAGVFGFRTWWLSKDVKTHRAVKNCFKKENRVHCYLRPDFLLNFIALSANRRQASKIFDKMFPTLVGISISHHVKDEVCDAVHQTLLTHQNMSPARVKAVVGSMTTELMSQMIQEKPSSLSNYLNKKLDESNLLVS